MEIPSDLAMASKISVFLKVSHAPNRLAYLIGAPHCGQSPRLIIALMAAKLFPAASKQHRHRLRTTDASKERRSFFPPTDGARDTSSAKPSGTPE
jgi:hypothetical protein